MFIGICGSICAGKSTVAQYLVDHHGFRHLHIEPLLEHDGSEQYPQLNGDREPVSNARKQHSGIQGLSHMTIPQSSATTSRTPPLPFNPPRQSFTFPTTEDLLDFVTKRWRERWVTTDILDEGVLDIFARRPFFLLICVDAPIIIRWQRFLRRPKTQGQVFGAVNGTGGTADTNGEALVSLDDFVQRSDAQLYDPVSGQLPLMARATVRLLNTSSDLAHLYATLGKVDLLNEDRLRPSWDSYFMALASLAAQRSNCMKRRVGCVLVREKRVISTGYNGTPRGLRNCGEGGCGRCNEGHGSGVGLATCLCIHAEENALLEAGRERIREGAILYCDTCPCLTCSIKITQVGISEVVYSQGYSMDRETAAVFQEAGVRLRQFVPPANGLIHLEKMELY